MRKSRLKLDRRFLTLLLLTATAALLTACPSVPVNNSPSANSGSPPAASSPAPPEKTPTPTLAGTSIGTGSLATPTEAYKTAFEIRQRKDGPGLKKVLSKEILEFFAEIGGLEKRSLDEMLQELAEKPQAATPEVRSEKISGDRAIIEYRDEKGEWKEMDFVKEDGGWKLTLPKADGPVTAAPPKKP